jgi:hypothetical protein
MRSKDGWRRTYQDPILDHPFQSFSSLDKMVFERSSRSGNTIIRWLLRKDRGQVNP